ncbi:MAG: response regulator [Flavobacteriales bacterium]
MQIVNNLPVKIVIADDHTMFVEGIVHALQGNNNIVVAGTASTGTKALTVVKSVLPDVILLDINMPEMDGVEVAKIMRKEHPLINIIIVSMYLEKEFIAELVRIGVTGYILKNTGIEELEKAVLTVASGKKYFSNDVALKMMDAETTSEYAPDLADKSELNKLTEREIDVLKLIALEHTTSEIAEKLFISSYTVETHRKNLIRKLNVKNIAGLVKFAVQQGLTD